MRNAHSLTPPVYQSSVSSKCIITVYHHSVSSQCVITVYQHTVYHHSILSQCIITMYHHNVSSQCIITVYHHSVSSQCIITAQCTLFLCIITVYHHNISTVTSQCIIVLTISLRTRSECAFRIRMRISLFLGGRGSPCYYVHCSHAVAGFVCTPLTLSDRVSP
jgi:hypothetical protein